MCKAVGLQDAERTATITPSHMPDKKHRFTVNTWTASGGGEKQA
jgi:hypothetical protein